MRSHVFFEPIVTKICIWGRVVNVIISANFFENPKGFRSYKTPPPTAFPILNAHRPYNRVSTTVLHCDRSGERFRFKTPVQMVDSGGGVAESADVIVTPLCLASH